MIRIKMDHRRCIVFQILKIRYFIKIKKFFLRLRAQFKKNGDLKEYEVNLKNREEDGQQILKI